MSDNEGRLFSRPICLLQSTPGGLKLNEEAAQTLEKITDPLVVVAIAGKYRTGKSYILNLLGKLSKNEGFALGDTVEAQTKGIWVYVLRHPIQRDKTLVLLDTEGLGDVERGDATYDAQLLVLSLLLSSTFIMNVMGRLDDDVINQLGFVSILTKSMKTTADGNKTGVTFDLFFPQLVVLVRDFALLLRVRGKDVTATEYFNDHCLQIKDKSSENAMKYNEPRALIRKIFPKRHCVTLPIPVYSPKLLQKLEEVENENLNPDFVTESQEFMKFIIETSEPKALTRKARVNGRILISLLRNYLTQILDGAVPCVESFLQSTAKTENAKLLAEFIDIYEKRIRESVPMPVSLEFLTDMHQKLCLELTEAFRKKIIFEGYKNELVHKFSDSLSRAFKRVKSENESSSKRACESWLKECTAQLQKKLDYQDYYKPGGHAAFSADLTSAIEIYNNILNKSVKHGEVLSVFLEQMDRIGSHIYMLDDWMSMEERQAEAERAEQEHLKRLAKIEQERARQEQLAAEEMQRQLIESQNRLQQELAERDRKYKETQETYTRILHERTTSANDDCVIL